MLLQVDEVGPGVTLLEKGDRVYGFTRFGAYVSHVNVPETYCRRMPSSWSFAEGAAFLVQGLTAWHAMIELGAAKKGQSVLVHSAAGGVGALAMELCQKIGASPIATIGSDKKVSFLMERFGIKVSLTRRRCIRVSFPVSDGHRSSWDSMFEKASWACESCPQKHRGPASD